MNKIDKKVVQQILKEELMVFKLNKTIIQEHKQLVSKRQDFNSLVLKEILYKKYGKDFNIYKIDEGLWDKVKNMVAVGGNKLGKFFKMGKSDTQKDMDNKEVNALISKAGATLPAGLIKQLTQPDPDGERFPNQESGEAFASRLEAIQFAYGAIVAALEAGTLPHESAEAAILALRRFLLNSMDKMSRVYKTFNEEEENSDEVLEEDLLNEISLSRMLRLVKQGKKPAQWAYDKIAASGNLRYDLKDKVLRDLAQQIPEKAADVASAASGAAGATKAAVGAAGATKAAATTAGITKGVATTTAAATPAKIATSIKAAPALKFLLGSLGVSPAMAAAGVGAALIGGLYLKGKISSRGASIKRLIKTMEVPPATAQTNVVPEPGEPPPAPTSEPSGRGDVYVFRGKGGKGIQSQLAKAGISGKNMSRILKALRKDLSAAGFNVLEEAKRETISLENTLAALDQMEVTDAASSKQKAELKKILIQLLRSNKIRIDPESSKKLRGITVNKGDGEDAADPTPPESEEAPEAVTPTDKKPVAAAKKKTAPPIGATAKAATDDEEEEKKPKYKKHVPSNLDMSTDESIDRKDQVIIERWQRISGINKKEQ